jgi:hypothetical protein
MVAKKALSHSSDGGVAEVVLEEKATSVSHLSDRGVMVVFGVNGGGVDPGGGVNRGWWCQNEGWCQRNVLVGSKPYSSSVEQGNIGGGGAREVVVTKGGGG